MSIIYSPVKAFQGNVTLPAHLTMPQVLAWEEASEFAKAFLDQAVAEKKEQIRFSDIDKLYVPAICMIAEKWQLEGLGEILTPETFPFSPRKASHELVDWLCGEIRKIYSGEIEIPNA